MAIYKLMDHPDNAGQVISIRRADNNDSYTYIPLNEGNADYAEYLEWLKIDGNEPEAAD